jgi:hypothetical protein
MDDRFGSEPEILKAGTASPLYPRKRGAPLVRPSRPLVNKRQAMRAAPILQTSPMIGRVRWNDLQPHAQHMQTWWTVLSWTGAAQSIKGMIGPSGVHASDVLSRVMCVPVYLPEVYFLSANLYYSPI